MTQPARRFELWRRLYRRFLIEPLPAQSTDQPSVLTSIQPVTDADELLVTRRVIRTVVVTSAAQQEIIYTVPVAKRAVVISAWFALSTGTYTLDAWLLHDGTNSLPLAVLASVTEDARQFGGARLKMETGWTFRVSLDAHSSEGNLTTGLLVEEEDAF